MLSGTGGCDELTTLSDEPLNCARAKLNSAMNPPRTAKPMSMLLFVFMIPFRIAMLCLQTEGARTQRTPPRGTAKRPSRECAKPRPMGACSVVSGLKIRGFLSRP